MYANMQKCVFSPFQFQQKVKSLPNSPGGWNCWTNKIQESSSKIWISDLNIQISKSNIRKLHTPPTQPNLPKFAKIVLIFFTWMA